MPSSPGAARRDALRSVALFWLASLAILVVAGAGRGFLPPAVAGLAWGLVSSCLLLLLTRTMLRRDGLAWPDAGIGLSWRSLGRGGLGWLLGLGTHLATLAAVSTLVAPLSLEEADLPPWGFLFRVMATIAALVVMEELGFRGYPFRRLLQALGPWAAQAVVVIAFLATHLLYGWPARTVLLGVLPSAVLFGVAAWVSGGLALPMGIHAGVNMARWLTGETADAGLWTVQALHGQDAIALWAPWIGAGMPLAVAGLLAGAWRRPEPPPGA